MSSTESNAGVGYTLTRGADLAGFTTFRVSARAALLAQVDATEALPEAMGRAGERPVFVLGGGSNVLFTGDFDGMVLRLATRGCEVLDESAEAIRLRVAAGENWDALVRRTLAAGFAGLENLILIPGSVGAAPIQNIGAYGVEFAEFVTAVEAWDRAAGDFTRLDATACGFAYRDSVFKHEPERYVVTALELNLPRRRELRLDYTGVREELQALGIAHPRAGDVAHAVERLRLRKLPNPAEIGNAGSFFKNPIVPRERGERLRTDYPALPLHPVGDGETKLSAAWLIEACGFKGYREDNAGVSEKHALVLVNHGGATGADILALAARIRAAVADRFGVALEPEIRVL